MHASSILHRRDWCRENNRMSETDGETLWITFQIPGSQSLLFSPDKQLHNSEINRRQVQGRGYEECNRPIPRLQQRYNDD